MFSSEPKLIAPVVAYLCHESNNENGTIIESSGGWAAKVNFMRSKGSLLRSSIDDDVNIEYVQNVWNKITDMSNAEEINSTSVNMSLFNVLESLQNKKT